MTSLSYSTVGASQFTIDFAAQRQSLAPLFNNNADLHSLAQVRAGQGASRRRLDDLCRQAFGTLPISPAQEQQLAALASTSSVVAITGQQVGFLGGPLYTVLKIASTVAAARQLSEQLGRQVIPMFWLEDNDHDAAEAGTATMPDVAGNAVIVRLWDGDPERKAVYRRTVSAHDVQRAQQAAELLHGQCANAATERIRAAYYEGASWSDAMMSMLYPYLAHWGVLALRGSHVIASGMHGPIIRAQAERPGSMAAQVAQHDAMLESLGYKAQASVGDYPFFVEVDGMRHRPITDAAGVRVGGELWTHEQLVDVVTRQPSRCSPGVLLRPVLQDALLPSIVNVVGGAEAAYHAQLGNTYRAQGVERPLVWLRHSATIIDQRTQRLMAKSGLTLQDVLRPLADVERDAVAAAASNVIPDVEQRPLLEEWREAAATIDPTLQGAVAAAEAAIGKALEQLAGKMRSALKRKHAEQLDRVRTVAGTVYPTETLQERVTPMSWFEARLGYDTFRKIAEAITAHDRDSHHVVVDEQATLLAEGTP